MAVAEEQFFRAGLLSWIRASVSDNTVAIVASAAIFSAYHLAVYGIDINRLVYVFIGGVVLAWLVVKTNRISPSIIAHMLNNLAGVMFVG